MSFKFEDFNNQVDNAFDSAVKAFLYEVGGEVTSQTKKRTRVDTGQTKSAWDYVVDESEEKVIIGNPLENAIWEEFGTGDYAINGDGRKGGWRYQDVRGKWHYTRGKKPRKSFRLAINATRPKIKERALSEFGVKLK